MKECRVIDLLVLPIKTVQQNRPAPPSDCTSFWVYVNKGKLGATPAVNASSPVWLEIETADVSARYHSNGGRLAVEFETAGNIPVDPTGLVVNQTTPFLLITFSDSILPEEERLGPGKSEEITEYSSSNVKSKRNRKHKHRYS